MVDWIWQCADWPNFRYDLEELLPTISNARASQGKALNAIAGLSPAQGTELSIKVLEEEAIATSAIEGERLNQRAVHSAVVRQLGFPAPSSKPVPRPVEGLIEVLLDASENPVSLTLERLYTRQAALLPDEPSFLSPVRAGQLRGDEPMEVVSGPIERRKIHFRAPPREGLETEIQAFLDWFNAPPPDLDGLIRAGLAHLWFVTLHPFDDGNGRLARAITDMALAQDAKQPMRLFSLSAQLLRQRKGYYVHLEQTQRGDLEVTPWLAWFLEQVRLAAESTGETI